MMMVTVLMRTRMMMIMMDMMMRQYHIKKQDYSVDDPSTELLWRL